MILKFPVPALLHVYCAPCINFIHLHTPENRHSYCWYGGYLCKAGSWTPTEQAAWLPALHTTQKTQGPGIGHGGRSVSCRVPSVQGSASLVNEFQVTWAHLRTKGASSYGSNSENLGVLGPESAPRKKEVSKAFLLPTAQEIQGKKCWAWRQLFF